MLPTTVKLGEFVIHKDWVATEPDQLTLHVGDVVEMEKSMSLGWATFEYVSLPFCAF
jgi:hypothetical protein